MTSLPKPAASPREPDIGAAQSPTDTLNRRALGASSSGWASSTSATTDRMDITPLGAGQKVGCSCCILYCGLTVMVGCGLHPAYLGIEPLPYLDVCEPSAVEK